MEQEPLWPDEMENELQNDDFNRSNGSFEGFLSSPALGGHMDCSRNHSRGSQEANQGSAPQDTEPSAPLRAAEAEWMKLFAGDDEFDMKSPEILDPIINELEGGPAMDIVPGNMFLEGEPLLEELFQNTFNHPLHKPGDLHRLDSRSGQIEEKSIIQTPRTVIQVRIVCTPSVEQKDFHPDYRTESTSANNPTDRGEGQEKETQENEETGVDLFESEIWDSMPYSGYQEEGSSFAMNTMCGGIKKAEAPAAGLPMLFQVTRESQFELLSSFSLTDPSTPSPQLPPTTHPTYCSCKQSRCLKAYCLCFRSGLPCSPANCGCTDCHNDRSPAAREARTQAVFNRGGILEDTFDETCCECRGTGCLKRYCSCRKAGKGCSAACRCVGCKNRANG